MPMPIWRQILDVGLILVLMLRKILIVMNNDTDNDAKAENLVVADANDDTNHSHPWS